MKKRFIALFVLTVILGAGIESAHAATTATFFPGTIATQAGETFDVPILINPQGVKNYSASIQVNYPADIVSATGFTFGNKAIPLSVDEYNSINNTNGVLIKSAGYPGGLTDTTIFGTIHFRALKTGVATLSLAPNSKALNVDNQNVLDTTSTTNASVSIGPALITSGTAIGGSGTGGTSGTNSGTNVSSSGSSGSGAVVSPTASPSPQLTGVGGPEEGAFGDNTDLGAAAGTASSTNSGLLSGKGTAIAIGVIILIVIIGIIYGASRGA